MSTVIGLSFGNTTSSIAYLKEGNVEVIANQDGDRTIPSMLAYAHGDEFHGTQAKLQTIRNAVNTIGYFRDFVALPFDKIDASASERTAKPLAGADGLVAFSINGETKSVAEIIERQFTRLHESAREYIGKDIDGVVLALPFGFPDFQRKALVDIASKAGLSVKQVIGELSAALLAHTSREDVSTNDNRLVVVSDFGGTRSDAAVISLNSGIYTVLATHSDTKLGGRLLDAAVLEYMANEFEQQYKVNPLGETRAVAKLLLEAESMRKTLSNSTTTQFGIDSVASGFDFSGSLNRLKYELIARQVFGKFAEFVSELLTKASINPLLVDEVLLVGGVSFSPKLANVIGGLFDERTTIVAPSKDTKAIDPDELIARGCAIQGSLITGLDNEELAAIEKHASGTKLSKDIGVKIGDKVVKVLGAHTLSPTKETVEVTDFPATDALEIVEIVPEIETTVHKPEPKAENAEEEDDDESDWGDSEDEEYEVHTVVNKPVKTLAQIKLPVQDKVKATLYFNAAQKVQVIIASNGQSVQGTI